MLFFENSSKPRSSVPSAITSDDSKNEDNSIVWVSTPRDNASGLSILLYKNTTRNGKRVSHG